MTNRIRRVLAVPLVTLAACSSDGGEAQPAATTSTAPIVSTTAPDLGAAKTSGIEGLPVPAAASAATGYDYCSGSADCRQEQWTVPNASPAGLRSWYGRHLDQTRSWQDWKPCFPAEAATMPRDRLEYGWYKGETRLSVLLSQYDTSIAIRVQSGEMPCQ